MRVLSVTLKNDQIIDIPFSLECNLFQLLTTHEYTRVRSACQEKGTCSLCLVCIDAGEGSALTHYEYERLSTQQLKQNIRLACQVRVALPYSYRFKN